MDAFTISFHRCYLLIHICFSPPPSYYSLHCVTLHYTAASRGCCNGSAAAAASAQLCNCSDTSSSVMNSCLFRLCCIFLTSCKGSGALLLHFPSREAEAAVVTNDQAVHTSAICIPPSTCHCNLFQATAHTIHWRALWCTRCFSIQFTLHWQGGLPYCMRLMTPLHPLPYFSPRYVGLCPCPCPWTWTWTWTIRDSKLWCQGSFTLLGCFPSEYWIKFLPLLSAVSPSQALLSLGGRQLKHVIPCKAHNTFGLLKWFLAP